MAVVSSKIPKTKVSIPQKALFQHSLSLSLSKMHEIMLRDSKLLAVEQRIALCHASISTIAPDGVLQKLLLFLSITCCCVQNDNTRAKKKIHALYYICFLHADISYHVWSGQPE